jgi:hypothetical protein
MWTCSSTSLDVSCALEGKRRPARLGWRAPEPTRMLGGGGHPRPHRGGGKRRDLWLAFPRVAHCRYFGQKTDRWENRLQELNSAPYRDGW